MEIQRNDVAFKPILSLDRATRDALATYARLRFPTGTAKHVAAEWGLTLDEARGLILGRTSLATLDRIWKHPKGGWSVLIPVMGAVVGETVDVFIEKERERHEQQAARLGALARSFRTGADRSPSGGGGLGAGSLRGAFAERSRVGAENTAEAD